MESAGGSKRNKITSRESKTFLPPVGYRFLCHDSFSPCHQRPARLCSLILRFFFSMKTILCLASAALLTATPMVSSAAVYVDAITASNPVAFYRLSETSGTTASNAAQPGLYDAVYENVLLNQPTPGLPGTSDPAVRTTGAASPQSSITTPEITSLGMGSFSVEFLFKDESNRDATALSYFFTKGPTHGATYLSLSVMGNYNGPSEQGRIRFSFRKEWNDAGGVTWDTGVVMPADVWNQVVLTYDQSASVLSLYLNGTSILTLNDFEMGSEAIDLFTFGRRFDNLPIAGQFADISIYNYALHQATVTSHYEALNAVPEPGTTALLGLGALAGVIAYGRTKGATLKKTTPVR